MKTTPLRLRAFAAFLVLAASPAFAIDAFNADYTASYMGMQANARMTLAPAGAGQWKYSLTIHNGMANLAQNTLFEDRAGQWRPLSGDDSASVLIKKRNKLATYDWSRGEARWSGDVKPDRAGPVKLQVGDLDAMLLNLAVVRDANAGKTSMTYRMVDDGRAKPMRYSVAGHEKITIGGATRDAIKLSSTDGNKQYLVWVVQGVPAPARILQRKNGQDEMDLRLKSLD